MSRVVVLDTGVVGLLTHPQDTPESEACRAWLAARLLGGDRVVLPDLADYEVRREYELTGAQRAIQRLDALGAVVEYASLTTPVLRRAASLWAQVRRRGVPTADRHALDGDVILASQALLLAQPGDILLIATTNVKHLALFADARLWSAI